MPSKKVKNVLSQFRARFQSEEANLPLSLRQESHEIIFKALLEDDESPMPPPTPMLGFSPEQDSLDASAGSQQDIMAELLNASMPTQELEGGPPPMSPQQALPQEAPQRPQQPAAPTGGGNPLEDLLGMM